MDTEETNTSQNTKTIRTGIKIGYQGKKDPASVSELVAKNQGVSAAD